MRVLPQQIAGGRVERLHLVAVGVDEHHAVVNERRDFIGAVRQRPAPREPQVADVVARDLRQRAEALRIERSPPREPLTVGGRTQHQSRSPA